MISISVLEYLTITNIEVEVPSDVDDVVVEEASWIILSLLVDCTIQHNTIQHDTRQDQTTPYHTISHHSLRYATPYHTTSHHTSHHTTPHYYTQHMTALQEIISLNLFIKLKIQR